MFLQVNGHLLHTVSFGGGATTFLALGGWVADWELWQQPFELLSSSWRCVAYDHRGAGESVVPLDAIHPTGLVDDVFGVMDALGIDRCILAGESLGAVVALQAAARQPERFSGLVLVAGGSGVTPSIQPLIDGARTDFDATVNRFVEVCTPEPNVEHLRRWGRDQLKRAGGPAAERILASYLERKEPPAPLEKIAVPTLLIHGTADAVIHIGVARWIARTIPGAKLVELDGAGHCPTLTRPREVVDAIQAWAATRLMS